MLRTHRKLAVLAMSIMAATATIQNTHAQDVLDGLAAVVDDKVITFSQIREMVAPKERAAHDKLEGKELAEAIKKIRLDAINELVDRQLILAYFKKQGYSLPSYLIEDRIATVIREEYNGDRAAFARKLATFGYTIERFRKEEMDKIIVQSMRQQVVKSTPVLPVEKLREFYQQHIKDFSTEEQTQISMIILRSSEKGNLEQRQQLLEEIRGKITAGTAFAEMARTYSDDSTAEAGGDWGWIQPGMLNETLSKAAFALKAGQTSKVLTLGDSAYLLHCDAKRPRVVQSFDEARDTIEKVLVSQERQKAQEEWVARLRKKAYIKIF
ncbi:MAG: peptidylprolyl isomerase [Verrucomicrobiota bacterium]